jgi:hypothetical protein
MIDLVHDRMSSNIVAAVSAVDRFFGDERLLDEGQGTLVRLAAGIKIESGEGTSFDSRFRLRLALPHLSRRLQIVVEEEIETSRLGEGGAVLDAAGEAKPDTALRYFLIKKPELRLSADAGGKGGSNPQALARLRGRYRLVFEAGELRLTETVRYLSADGVDATTEIRWSQPVGDWLVSAASSLRWAEQEEGTTPRQVFSFYKDISGRRAYRLDLVGTWPESPNVRRARYEGALTYRQLLYKRWLFVEARAGLAFPEEDDYDAKPLGGILLDVLLGDLD